MINNEINILPDNKKISLSDKCFGVDYKKTLVHQVVTSYFSNGRENISSQKNRSAVRGGGKKPWRQKAQEEQELVLPEVNLAWWWSNICYRKEKLFRKN